MPVEEALKRSLLVYGLSPEQIAPICELAKLENFTAGEHLTMIGQKEADLFVIVDGRVKVLTHDSDELGEIGPGGILGEISFVDGGPRHFHAVATGYTTAYRLPAIPLRRLMGQDKIVGFTLLCNLSRLLSSRLRNADGRLDALMDLEHDAWHHAL